MEQEPQEGGYSREAFEAIEKEISEIKEQMVRYPEDPSWQENLDQAEVRREQLLNMAHEEALEENERRNQQEELSLE
jgi:hypothetical protein